MDEKHISWKSDRENKFKQVNGFKTLEVPQSITINNNKTENEIYCTVTKEYTGYTYYNKTDSHLCYYYPDSDSVKYLYQIYPDQISPIDGVTDEHFIVWMRTAGLPTFRKLYGKIDSDLKKGDELEFNIKAYFDVNGFEGTKSIVISTVGQFGGKNPYLGVSYIVVGSISLFLGAVFLLKFILNPREQGDVSKLHWN